jgi:molecular chaperone DnaK
MALQLSLRRGANALRASTGSVGTSSTFDMMRRFKSTDAGDVIGIDLGTTNSCVAIMVRLVLQTDCVSRRTKSTAVAR